MQGKRGKIVVDDWEQASHSGEISIPLSEGNLNSSDIYSELSEIVTGDKAGRESEEEITIFDSTGLAIQDIASAHRLYQEANDNDMGKDFDLI